MSERPSRPPEHRSTDYRSHGNGQPHGQSAIARGMMLAHRTTSMTMSLIVPVGAGYWADQRWGTTPWLASLGALIGFPLFMMQILAFADSSKSKTRSPRTSQSDPE